MPEAEATPRNGRKVVDVQVFGDAAAALVGVSEAREVIVVLFFGTTQQSSEGATIKVLVAVCSPGVVYCCLLLCIFS